MSSHRRDNGHDPAPNWLKVFYALLAFMVVVLLITTLTHK